ncbi:MAG: substrate-binding domain-containing protein [Anaerolineae bacterium]|nr:substrate-binding domain-containing protein [Anaerolineae bacterium]
MRRAKRTAKRTLALLGLALAGCQGSVSLPVTITPHVVPVRILVTTAAYPLLQDVVDAYSTPETVLAVNSTPASWATIQTRLLTERAGTGSASEAWYALTTFLPSGLPPDLVSDPAARGWWVAPVGRDGIAVIVHPANTVESLTLADLRALLAGEITTWAAVGGGDEPVVIVSREPGADTRLVLEATVMHSRLPPGDARLALSDARMAEWVARTPGAIGYVSMGWLADCADMLGVRIVPLAATADSPPILPDPATVSAERYPLHTPVMIVGLSPPDVGSAIYDWFAWIQSDAGQHVVTRRYGSFSPTTEPARGNP